MVYLDDGIFSGEQSIQDVAAWLESDAVHGCLLDIVALGMHQYGVYNLHKRIAEQLKRLAISVRFKILWGEPFENRRVYRQASDVLWPIEIPDDPIIEKWKTLRGLEIDQFYARPAGWTGKQELFSTDHARQVVERAFLTKGAYICTQGEKYNRLMRPLGFTTFRNVGFGSLFCTYRNCPNNAPLVLWWGDPKKSDSPLGKWYPLLERKARPPTENPQGDRL